MAAVYGSFSNIWHAPLLEVASNILFGLRDEPLAIGIILVIIGSILGPIAVIANAIVITAVWKDPYKQLRSSPSNIIITSMAVCDFLVGVVCSTFMTYTIISLSSKELPSREVHQAFLLSLLTFIGLSVLHVFALTIDRFIAVVRPLRYKSYVTKKRLLWCMLGMWLFTLIAACVKIPFLGRYFIFSFIFFLFFNVVIVATFIMSIIIVYRIKKPCKALVDATGNRENMKNVIARNKKVTKSIILIVAIFKACFTPFSICWMILLTCGSCNSHLSALLLAYCSSALIMIFNSCLNPFIYAFRLPKFKKPIYYIMKKVFCCLCNSFKDDISIQSSARATHNEPHNDRSSTANSTGKTKHLEQETL